MTTDVTDNRCEYCGGVGRKVISVRWKTIGDTTFQERSFGNDPCPRCAPAAKEPGVRLPPGFQEIGEYVAECEKDPAKKALLDAARVDLLRQQVAALQAQVEAQADRLDKLETEYPNSLRCGCEYEPDENDFPGKCVVMCSMHAEWRQSITKLTAENASQTRQLTDAAALLRSARPYVELSFARNTHDRLAGYIMADIDALLASKAGEKQA